MRSSLSNNRKSGFCTQREILEIYLPLFTLAVSYGDGFSVVFTLVRSKMVHKLVDVLKQSGEQREYNGSRAIDVKLPYS